MPIAEPIVLEFADENRNPLFPPLPERPMRGRFDSTLAVKRDADASKLLVDWPDGIPGERLEVNPETGEAAIVEPLRDPRFAAIADKLKQRGLALPPARQPLPQLDKPTALYWVREAVRNKQAVLISGKLPDKIEGTPRTEFILSPPPPSPLDRLTEALLAQATAFARLADVLEKTVTRK